MNTNNLTNNLLLNTDVYKITHFKFMPENTTKVFSYIEARKGGLYPFTKFFNLQGFIKQNFLTPITKEMIDEAEEIMIKSVGVFNRNGWEYILKTHGGYLPLKINAVKEGMEIPEGNVLVTIENTDPNCAWLTNYFETAILRACWYGSTVATKAKMFKNIVTKYHELTAEDVGRSSYVFVDFGARAAAGCKEAAAIGGAASIMAGNYGSDNILGAMYLMDNYHAPNGIFGSIPATEHQISTLFGPEHEKEYIFHAINVYGGKGKFISLVADTYSLEDFLDLLGSTEVKDKIIDNGCTIVVRPDSGIPHEIVLNTLEILGKSFGYTINSKGYRKLNDAVRVIQGDGIVLNSLEPILEHMMNHGWSAENVVFGSGHGLIQDNKRDDGRWCLKASYAEVNGVSRMLSKNPKTDPTKKSKSGRLTLVNDNGNIKTILESDITDNMQILLESVFENGKLLRDLSFNDIK